VNATPPDDFASRVEPPAARPFVPAGREFATAWLAYGCFVLGIVLWWPSIVGLVISYVRRNEPQAGFIASHYRWLITTFWWSTVGWVVSFALIAAGVLPILFEALRAAARSGQPLGEAGTQTLLSLDWGAIFAAVGLAAAGGVGLLVTLLWLIYRLIRGTLRLADGRPVP